MRRKSKQVPEKRADPSSSLDIPFIVSEFDRHVANDLQHMLKEAVEKGDRRNQELVFAETLKYFRIIPMEWFESQSISPYFKRVIEFIQVHECSGEDVTDEIVLTQIALCHLVLGDSLRAFQYLSRVRNPDPSPETAFIFGFTCYALDRYDTAMKYFTIAENCEDEIFKFDAIYAKANINFQREEYQQALIEFKKLLELGHPVITNDDVRLSMATTYFFIGDHDQCFAIIDSLDSSCTAKQQIFLEADRNNMATFVAKGNSIPSTDLPFDVIVLTAYIFYKQRKYSEAYRFLQRLHSYQNGSNPSLWLFMALCLYLSNPCYTSVALSLLNNAYVVCPGNPWVEKTYGCVLECGKRFDEAEAVYKKMLDGDRFPGYARYRLGQIALFKECSCDGYDPPDIGNLPASAIMHSPHEEQMEMFRTGMLFCSTRMMSFLGDVEPEINGIHAEMSMFLEKKEKGDEQATLIRTVLELLHVDHEK